MASLVRLGQSPDADLLYRTLVNFGPRTAADLATDLGMALRRVGRALDELASAGAVAPEATVPSRAPTWTPRPAAEVAYGRRTHAGTARAPLVAALVGLMARHLHPAHQPAPAAGLTPLQPREPAPAAGPAPLQPREPAPTAGPAPLQPREPAPTAGPAPLQPRERALIALLAAGHTEVRAARELGISRRTVSYILRDMMDRLGVANRFQLGLTLGARYAIRPPHHDECA
ncbi:helix-turn-helix transcriptional regulator [Phytohabitans sp. LJ34]|uniref:helix-turn-helix transcriptional regulator n=1 Tax=Phytohabitans sp. LJ34 TaxID=3452217 RepID=UPI003F89CBB7